MEPTLAHKTEEAFVAAAFSPDKVLTHQTAHPIIVSALLVDVENWPHHSMYEGLEIGSGLAISLQVGDKDVVLSGKDARRLAKFILKWLPDPE